MQVAPSNPILAPSSTSTDSQSKLAGKPPATVAEWDMKSFESFASAMEAAVAEGEVQPAITAEAAPETLDETSELSSLLLLSEVPMPTEQTAERATLELDASTSVAIGTPQPTTAEGLLQTPPQTTLATPQVPFAAESNLPLDGVAEIRPAATLAEQQVITPASELPVEKPVQTSVLSSASSSNADLDAIPSAGPSPPSAPSPALAERGESGSEPLIQVVEPNQSSLASSAAGSIATPEVAATEQVATDSSLLSPLSESNAEQRLRDSQGAGLSDSPDSQAHGRDPNSANANSALDPASNVNFDVSQDEVGLDLVEPDKSASPAIESGELNSTAATVASPTATSTGNASATRAAASIDFHGTEQVSTQLGGHILDVRSSMRGGRGQLEVDLNPPELGKLTIELHEENDQLTAKLIVSRATTMEAVKSALPDLLRTLAEAGVGLANMELESSPQGGNDTPERDEAKVVDSGRTPQVQSQHTTTSRSDGVDVLA